MNRKGRKQIKKLFGIYKNCINAMSFDKNTKHYRNMIKNRIYEISKNTEVPTGLNRLLSNNS